MLVLAVGGLAVVAWSAGFFASFLLVEAAAAFAAYVVLRRNVLAVRWSRVE